MKSVLRRFKVGMAAVLIVLVASCEKDYLYEDPVSDPTSTLEAVLVTTPPATVNAAYWKTADYLKINASNVSQQHTYSDGFLNLTGTYNGLASFNNGTNPEFTLKAAYDQDNLYILAEWIDSDVDASNSSWLFNGPSDPNKSDTTNGWTSQRNCDKVAFAFEINAASGPAGTFSAVGCAAACHTNTGVPVMYPVSGKVDIWNWSLATSAPLGFAHDMVASSTGFSADNGQLMYARNAAGPTSRSGPAYEWDGSSQKKTLPSGVSTILDPGFYLLNKTPFTGDTQKGDYIYHHTGVDTSSGKCESCHGINGIGGEASALTHISLNKKSRSSLITAMANVADMDPYWSPLTSTEKNDIVAYLRGLSGVPGYYLSNPSGSTADITAVANITPVNILNALNPSTNKHTKYRVLITRKLKTNNGDDVQFDPPAKNTYKFGVALMDNDGINHIGSLIETLTFK